MVNKCCICPKWLGEYCGNQPTSFCHSSSDQPEGAFSIGLPCLWHENEPIVTRCRKPQWSREKYDCLPRLLGDGHLMLLGFERTWTPPQLLSTSTPSQRRAFPLFSCSHGCPLISPWLPKEMHPQSQSQSPPPLPFILTYLFRSSPLQGTEGIFGNSRWVIIHVRAAVTAEKLSLLKSDAVSDI